MNKVWIIAFREFLEIVRTKTFIISSVFIPLGIVGLVLAIEPIIETMQEDDVVLRSIAVLDHSGALVGGMIARAEAANQENTSRPLEFVDRSEASVEELQQAVQAGEYYAYLELPADITAGGQPSIGRKDNQMSLLRQINWQIDQAVRIERGKQFDPPLSDEAILALVAGVQLQTIDLTTGVAKAGSDVAAFMMPFAFMFLLFMGTMGISQHLLTSLIEEKNTRVIEVLLSAVSPLQLMAGKIVGISAVGMLLLAIWGALGYFSARWQGMSYLVESRDLFFAGIYFLPTFLLFAGVLGAIGSVCNTLKEAQSMTAPLTIVTIIPMMLWFPIAENPNSTLSVGASFVPFISSFVMILRLTSTPEIAMWQIVVTQVLLWASVVLVIWAAAKVFRIGVLMYGKQPSLGELFTWLRRA